MEGDERESLVDEAIRRRAALLVADENDPLAATLAEAGYRQGIAAPLIYEGRTVGGLAVYDRYGLEPWDETDVKLLASLANEAAVALKNVELFAAVERERALLAEESRKLGDIVDNASDGIVMIEGDGRVAVWNDTAAAITGVDGRESFGRPWYVVLRMRDAHGAELLAEGDHAIAAALRGERVEEPAELQVLRRDGEWRWVRCSINPIERSGAGTVGAVLILRDVTREHEVEELKADFVATVSHELRTPLTPLKGFLETLVTHAERLTSEQIDDVHTAMRGQLDRLERLVGDLLLVADVDRRNLGLHLEALDLTGLMDEAVLRLQPQLEDSRLHLDLPDWLGTVGDRAGVIRVLAALLENAAKHTDGDIFVSGERSGDRVHLRVRDEGPGIPPWEQERVFRRFGRLGDHLHRTQGPGLGLSIARSLAREMGGDVTIESDVGRGSTFTLELPASAPRAVSHEATRPSAS